MKLKIPEIQPEERTPLVESLLALLQQLLDRVQQLEETNQQLRDEIAILKGQKPRPKIRPSRLESSQPPPPEGQKRSGAHKCSKNDQLPLPPEEVVLLPNPLPPGAVFKGYEPYVVQELLIQAKPRATGVPAMNCPKGVQCWHRCRQRCWPAVTTARP